MYLLIRILHSWIYIYFLHIIILLPMKLCIYLSFSFQYSFTLLDCLSMHRLSLRFFSSPSSVLFPISSVCLLVFIILRLFIPSCFFFFLYILILYRVHHSLYLHLQSCFLFSVSVTQPLLCSSRQLPPLHHLIPRQQQY